MFNLNVPTINGIQNETVYNVYDFPYGTFKYKTVQKKRKKETIEYINMSCAFDIEASTIPKDESNLESKDTGFMYQWQFCVKDKVVFGRTWEEFIYFLDMLRDSFHLSDTKLLVVYVHNLAYEFQFIKDFIKIDSIFAKDKRKPMKLISEGIEFRCSYFLSNMSLIKFCENCKGVTHYKLVDTYDYRKIRTPETPLTEEELGYCYNDVRGLCECIDYMLEEDNIVKIPLTNTGYVRREFREAMKKNKNNRANFLKTQLNVEQYEMLKRAFRGGNTHANRFLSGCILPDVHSFDITSSYPTQMMTGDFPIGKFTQVDLDNQQKLDYFCNNYCVVMDVEFFEIDLKDGQVIPYIDIAHCFERSKKLINDNGRVLYADYIKMSITNIDLDIIRRTYDFKGFNVTKAYYAEKGKLPKEFRETLLHFYDLKTQLKDVDGYEYEYMKSKNKLNSSYGMTVTAIDHSEIKYSSETMLWDEDKPNLSNALSDFYGTYNSFLPYQWGVFVTANARKQLQDMLDIVGDDVVYIDTDSIKFINTIHVDEFLKMNEKLKNIAENNDIRAYSERKTDKGIKRYYLGLWDWETEDKPYIRFKTLGAKKYCYEQEGKDGKIEFHITVSGMSKKLGAKEVGTIENFEIGKTFYNVGRTVSTYNDNKPYKITVDGCTFTTASNIGITDTTYTLGVTQEYWELIKNNDIFNGKFY